MKKLLLAGLGVLVLTPRAVSAQTLNIDHQAVGCAVADKYPRFEARFDPADGVAVARVLFQAENAQQWYAVAMKAEGSAFSGVLPKPKKSLKAFKYYIEVTGKALGTNRTADYSTNVVGSSAECKGKLMAGALGSAAVLLQVPAGAAALPAGFASTGVVAASSGSAAAATGAAAGGGGGLGTGAVVGIVAGAGAVAAGAVVAVGKSGSSATTYSGPFNGPLSVTQEVNAPRPDGVIISTTCVINYSLNGTMKMTLEEPSGPATGQVDGSGAATQTSQTGGPTCNGPGPVSNLSWTCAVTGTADNLGCTEQRTSTSGGVTSAITFRFAGALSGGVIAGTVTYTNMSQGGGPGPNGPFTSKDTGSTTFAVTLR